MNNNDNDFNNAMAKVLAYGIARILEMDMTHEEALELAGVTNNEALPSDNDSTK